MESNKEHTDDHPELRRSERERSFTNRAREYRLQDYKKTLEKEKNALKKCLEEEQGRLVGPATRDELLYIKNKLNKCWGCLSSSLQEVLSLEEEEESRNKISDESDALKNKISEILTAIDSRLRASKEDDNISVSSMHSRLSHQSNTSKLSIASFKAVDAEANAAAIRAQLIEEENELRQSEEIELLQKEEERRRTEAEAALEKRKKELEKIRLQKKLKMEEAKAKVYREEEDRLRVGYVLEYGTNVELRQESVPSLTPCIQPPTPSHSDPSSKKGTLRH